MKRLVLALLLCGCTSEETTPDAGNGGVEARFTSLYGDYFSSCGQCHAPGAPGWTAGIEQTLDFTSKATAYQTITTGMASGLTGNAAACNGVPFIQAQPAQSLILAVLHLPTRQMFDLAAFPGCDVNSISDETVKVGYQPSAEFITALTTWIQNDAPND